MQYKDLKPDEQRKLSATGRKYFNLIEFDKEEQLICEIRKHVMGLIFIYFIGIMILIVISSIFGVIFSEGFNNTANSMGISATAKSLIIVGGVIFVFFIVVAMTIQAILYTNNVIYITSEKIAQVLYISLFNRKISQLSIGDVQDVTVTQKGILAHMFNFGTLVIETAGEQQNYTFSYIPNPYVHSKLIVGAHERNLVEFGN